LLRRRRQIADRHVLNHAAAQRAHLGHLKLLSESGLGTPHLLRQEGRHIIPTPRPLSRRHSGFVQSLPIRPNVIPL